MVDNILTKEIMLEFAYHKGKIVTRDFVSQFSVSRQYVSSLISDLVAENKLIKIGSTKKAFYVLPAYAEKHKDIYPIRYQTAFSNSGLEEHRVLDQIERAFPPLKELPENVSSIFAFAFSGMLNNAIEHSESSRIGVEVAIQNETLSFVVSDSGLGVFRNIKKKRKLGSELEAIQDLMKGKTTTMPKSHSGEGIFFTSKVGDLFVLDSYGRIFIVDNKRADVFIDETKKLK
ncbi:MAG: hypothetical protein KKH83_04710, partial [Candidatus Margulisbacteria bacterium]|nr:hypothetical protein [Candidatus Margulisiibacteriota bacterium]